MQRWESRKSITKGGGGEEGLALKRTQPNPRIFKRRKSKLTVLWEDVPTPEQAERASTGMGRNREWNRERDLWRKRKGRWEGRARREAVPANGQL